MGLNFKTLEKLSKNFSILYVEDDDVLRDRTKVVFDNLFQQVDTAFDGLNGFKKYQSYYEHHLKYYDIVITDIQMPNLNGIELTKKILLTNKEQKVIVVSAYDDKKYLLDLIHIGVEAFIEKPISSTNVTNVLYDVCKSLNNNKLIELQNNYTYDLSASTLFLKNIKVTLSDNESKLLKLLMENNNQAFNCIEIFNYLYFNEPDKDFSQDSIKSLVKRLRKKVPENFITNTQQVGYSVNLNP